MNGNKKFFKRLSIVVLTVVAFVITITSIYFFVHENFMNQETCSCTIPMTWVLVILTSLGVFVGMFTYYYLMESFEKEKEVLSEEIEKTLDFLDNDKKKIAGKLIENGGNMHQSRIVEETGMDKVKVSRTVSGLVDKDVVEKEDAGMSNLIRLKQPYRKLYLGDKE